MSTSIELRDYVYLLLQEKDIFRLFEFEYFMEDI